MRIVIVGNGFVANALKWAFGKLGHDATTTKLPIFTDPYPDLVVNAAGRKDIHWCEDNPYDTYCANVALPATLAEQLRGKCRFVHIGSDHAYGKALGSVYSRSKRSGDEAVIRANPQACVAVTGHVYGPGCPWVKWLDGELRLGRQVIAHNNRINRPTWIGDLASWILAEGSGYKFITGATLTTRQALFHAYCRCAGLDQRLIVAGTCDDPLLIDHLDVEPNCRTIGLHEGFERMLNGEV